MVLCGVWCVECGVCSWVWNKNRRRKRFRNLLCKLHDGKKLCVCEELVVVVTVCCCLLRFRAKTGTLGLPVYCTPEVRWRRRQDYVLFVLYKVSSGNRRQCRAMGLRQFLNVATSDHATMRQHDNATTRPCDNATIWQCDNASIRQCDNASTRNAKIRKKFATRCQHGILTQYLAVMWQYWA